MKLFRLLMLIALLAVPGVAFAADGDNCNLGAKLQAEGDIKGKYFIECFYLCDSKETGTNPDTCTEFDFQAEPHPGIPDKLFIQIHTVDACDAAYSVDINHGNVSAGTEHDLVTLNASTTAASVGPDVVLGRFLNTDVASIDTCTDFDVILWTYSEL